MKKQKETKSSKKYIKTNKNKEKKEKNYSSIILVIITILIIILIFFLSSQTGKKPSNSSGIFTFSSTEFESITASGVYEYQASIDTDVTSIFFFCSNEDKDCYNELSTLNKIAKENNLNIEYINVLELVDSEKENLTNISDIFDEDYYPTLVICQNKKIQEYVNNFLDEDEIIVLFKKYEIIK